MVSPTDVVDTECVEASQEEGRASKIKECFQLWDQDGNGYITKAELQVVLLQLMPPSEGLTRADIDRLMTEADRNGNGRIEYKEFVQWLTRPGASIHASSDGLELFDLAGVLEPLFSIYDRNGDGSITMEEFEECHHILQTAVLLHPAADQDASDPGMIATAAHHVFGEADKNLDRCVSFEEFVEWQRVALRKSGLSNYDLQDLVPALARQLNRVFKISEASEEGRLSGFDQNVLMHIIKNVATFSRDMYNDREAGRNSIRGKPHYTNRWSEPPVGLNVSRLKGFHVKLVPLPTGVDAVDLSVLCVPEPADMAGPRRWLARLKRIVRYKSGRQDFDDPFYYFYDNLNWSQGRGETAAEFETALEQLPPELRIFCVLKTEANFGVKMSWPSVQAAMAAIKSMGLLTEQQHELYNNHMSAMVRNTLHQCDMMADLQDKNEIRRTVEALRAKSIQAPRAVMAALAELGILKVSSAWADVLKA
mmetsp:Transcript_5266/g.15578  ORF Transcript_5266/g.15578 Transcript_5266/m.15578 type:complete len:479 (-) Transcript_5266:56-1492(-)